MHMLSGCVCCGKGQVRRYSATLSKGANRWPPLGQHCCTQVRAVRETCSQATTLCRGVGHGPAYAMRLPRRRQPARIERGELLPRLGDAFYLSAEKQVSPSPYGKIQLCKVKSQHESQVGRESVSTR
ncbi:hypothetical protein MRX96_029362 [Rhipicephalus microplus]